MNNGHRTLIKVFAGIVAVNVIGNANVRAQQPPPIQGVTGTIATEESIKDTSAAGHEVFGKIKRLFHMNKRGPDDAASDEALRGLKEGMRVLIRDATNGENPTAAEIDRLGDERLKQGEGAVTAVNRDDRTISVRLADGTRQTLRISDRIAADTDVDRPGKASGTMIVYYKNAAGRRVALYFKRVS